MRLAGRVATVYGRRRLALLALLACAVAASVAGVQPARSAPSAYVPRQLLSAAQAHPGRVFRVILQGAAPNGEARVVAAVRSRGARVDRALRTIAGASAALTGRQLLQLAATRGVAAITVDRPVELAGGISSTQQWPYAIDAQKGWSSVTNGKLATPPAIAVVDSGIDANRADFGFGARVLQQVTIVSSGTANSAGDGYGHGTFVSGLAAGSAQGYAGTAPSAPIVSIDVLNDAGMGLTSDVIAACDWIVRNKDAYDIRVANFSLHSTAPASVFWDPLDKAVERLWLDGVTVVAAAGNYGSGSGPSGVRYAPGNDPFVITVGADDLGGNASAHDDSAAPWSAYGYTYDGFAKPDLAAPGRYMVGPVPAGSTLATTRPDSVVAPGYMELSGTSFAAPIVSGTAAYLLAVHPTWTPDQVKGALMLSATAEPSAAPLSVGVGLVNTAAAAAVTSPPNPNLALDRFVVPDPAGGSIPVFDTAAWQAAALADPTWDATTWDSASWGSASWGSASWGSASWGSASWGSASWGSASWGSSSLAQSLTSSDASWGSAALGAASTADDVANDPPKPWLTPQQVKEAALDPAMLVSSR